MKASERLRELTREHVILSWDDIDLIADVVEAVENPDLWDMDDRLVYPAQTKLDRALTALRDALQPEPPNWGAERKCPETCG